MEQTCSREDRELINLGQMEVTGHLEETSCRGEGERTSLTGVA